MAVYSSRRSTLFAKATRAELHHSGAALACGLDDIEGADCPLSVDVPNGLASASPGADFRVKLSTSHHALSRLFGLAPCRHSVG